MQTVWNYLLLFLLRWTLLGNIASADGPMSGNAMDLAHMNMGLMQNGCPLLPCQSACMVKNQDSGCFQCQSACGTGSGLGMINTGPVNPGMRNPMQPVDGGQFFSCNLNWIACPDVCTRDTDQLGCFRCRCPPTVTPVKPSPVRQDVSPTLRSETVTVENIIASTAEPVPITTHVSTTPRKHNMTVQTFTNITTHTKKHASIITTHEAQLTNTQPTIPYTTTGKGKSSTVRKDDEQEKQNSNTVSHIKLDSLSANTNRNKEQDDTLQYMVIMFSLATLLVISLASSVILFVLWRRSAKLLSLNKDELYFANKVNRQESRARLSDSMNDPVYAHVQEIPEPPPREPSESTVTPTAPVTELMPSSTSFSSKASTKRLVEQETMSTHDYLELI